MKMRLFIFASVILVFGLCVTFIVQRGRVSVTPTETAQHTTTEQKEGHDMPDSSSESSRDYRQERIQDIEDDIRLAKKLGKDRAYIAYFEGKLELERQPLKPGEDELLVHYDYVIAHGHAVFGPEYIEEKKAKRAAYLKKIAEEKANYETLKRANEEKLAAYAVMSDAEKVSYHENEVKESEERLRLAKAENNTEQVHFLEMVVKNNKYAVEFFKGLVEKERSRPERDREAAEIKAELDEIKEKYRDYLVIEVVDGEEQIVGVKLPPSAYLTDRDPSVSEEAVVPMNSPSESAIPVSPEVDPVPASPDTIESVPTVPASPKGVMDSIVKVHTQFNTWHTDVITKKYLDVVISQYLTPAEFEKFFPTKAERQQLQRRTDELRKSVVSKVREVVSGVKGATPEQKRQLARELVTASYEKSFAELVLKALEQDVEE